MTEDYAIDWSLVANVTPYTHADFTMAAGTVQIVSGNLKPATNTYNAKMCFTGEAIDRSKYRMVARVVLGDGPLVYSDVGGPGFFILSGVDIGKGYWIRQNGQDLQLYQTDTQSGIGGWVHTFGNINTATGADAATGGELDLELDNIDTTATMRAYYDGTQVGGTFNPTTYIASIALVPALYCDWGNSNARGWTGFAMEGIAIGGFSLTDVNGDNVIDHSAAFTINGDFSSVTISAVTLKQTGATNKNVSFSEAAAALTCTAIDFHTDGFMDGAATIEVTDGTDTLELDVTIDFSNSFQVDTAISVSTNGMWKDVTGAAAGDTSHCPASIAGSPLIIDTNGMLASLYPSVPNGSTVTWYHGADNVWTPVNATINQADVNGPAWAVPSAWSLTDGLSGTYDAAQYATTSGGSIAYALNPAESGFAINAATGLITYDGTAVAGAYWLTVEGTDDNGTTAMQQLAVTVDVNLLTISNDRVTSITQTTATITVDAAAAVGDVYLAARDSGPYTDPADVKAEVGADWAGNKTGALTLPFYADSLTAFTLYYYAIVQESGGEDSNMLTGTFTTQSDITYTETGKAPAPRPY